MYLSRRRHDGFHLPEVNSNYFNGIYKELPFEVLSDRGNQVAQKYRVAFTLPDSMRWVYSEIFKLDPPRFNGDDSWTLPMPSRFIVDQHAVIRAADVNLDHTVRPEPDTAIEVLKILLIKAKLLKYATFS